MGCQYEQLSLEDRCEIARLQAEGRSIRQIAAALDRAPSTISREVKRNERAAGRLQTKLRPGTDAGAALGGVSPGPRPRPAPCRAGSSRQGLVSRTGRRPARPRDRPQRHQPREHLPVHLRPDRPHQGLPLAALSAPREEQTRLPRSPRRQPRRLHQRPYFRVRTPSRSRRARAPPVTGKPTWCCSPNTVRPCSPSTSGTRASCSPLGRPTKPPSASPAISSGCSRHCRSNCAKPSPSTTAPSSLAISSSTGSPSRPSSATRMPHGRKAASRTLSVACAAFSPARPTSPPCQTDASRHLIGAYNNTPRKCLDFRTPAEVFSRTVALRM